MCHVKILLLFSIIYGSQSKNISDTTVRNSVEDDDGKSSLVFVFDTTGSMYNDLKQLREGAELILNTALEESDVIGDFVFVPFHDPVVGPATVTHDKAVFHSALNIVRVYGGGDCPEKALSGIQLALDVSRPRSFVYVFTDATAADHRLVTKVLDQVQRKQSQVAFVLTGHCNDLDRPSYKVYQQIAAASSGQVFNLNKTSVHKVLDFVRSSIKGRSVNLGSVVQPAGHNYTQGIPVDSTLSEVTVSVSGAKPQIHVVNPNGEEVSGPPQLVTTLDLSEIMVVKVLQPEAGNWTITVGSEHNYSVKVAGVSNLTFTHGFSATVPRTEGEVSYRPLKGTYNHMLIKLTPVEAPVDINYAQIVSMDGKTLFEVPLKMFNEKRGVYIADAFVPPDDFFYIAIGGKDQHNQEVRRIGATAVQAKLPDVPYITTPPVIKSRSHERVVLKCFVESLVPITAFWTKDMAKVQPQISALQSTTVEYVIEDMREEHVGSYKCVAKNVAGIGTATTELSLIVDPPLVLMSPENTTILVGENITIYCAVYTEAFLTKFQLVHSGIGTPKIYYNIVSEPNIEGEYSVNKTIIITKDTDGGTYSCVAANRGGESTNSTQITVLSKPAAQILGPHTLTHLIHTTIQIACMVDNADGMKWVAPNGTVVYDVAVTNSHTSALDLVVESEGVWTCVGVKGELNSTDALELKTLIKPIVHIEGSRNVTIEVGTSVDLICVVVAKPAPRVLWHRETEDFLNHTVQLIAPDTYKSVLHLNSSVEVLDGMYFCYGENSQGIDYDNATVRMRKNMVVLRKFTDTIVPPYTKVELHCEVESYPTATTIWRKDNQNITGDENLKLTNGTLTILRVNFYDEGVYTCEVGNDYEMMKNSGTLRILVCPEVSKEAEKTTVLQGQSVVIPCSLLQGYPKPHITWQYKRGSDFSELPSNAILNDTDLVLYNASVDVSGVYRCVAENSCGKDEFTTTLVVLSPPELMTSKEELNAMSKPVEAGVQVSFRCKAGGTPRPAISWTKDGRPVPYSTRVYLNNTSFTNQSVEQLIIDKAKPSDSGLYICNAASALGSVQKEFPLIVYEAPVLNTTLPSTQITVIEGEYVELPCRVSGHPIPEVTWLHHGHPVYDERRFIDDTGLRFIANLTDFGTYTCFAKNEYANASLEFSLYVWVPPSIEPPLEVTKSVLVGENITLQCNVVGFPLPNVMWEFNDNMLKNDTTNLSFIDGDVQITNATLDHEGLYKCIAENIAGIMMKTIWLNVNEPLKILTDAFEGPYIATNMDTELVIPCNVSGKPKPYIVWSKDEYYLNNDPRASIDVGGTLTLRNPTEDMSGQYVCTARNSQGEIRRTVEVQVYSLAMQMQSEQSHKTVSVVEGQQVNVDCPIPASSKDLVKWYKDAKIISLNQLRLTNVTRHDAGAYACLVTNAVSSASSIVHLSVEWPPKFVENGEKEVEVVKGEDKYFDCDVDAKPAAKTKWLFNSRPMLFEDRPRLRLLTVQLWHTGVYQCVVTNKHGAVARQFALDVLEPPFISEFDLLDVELKEGSDASLPCDARGSPEPSVKWTYNNTNWHKVNSTLTTTNITSNSSGLYRCDATNKAGSAHLVYRVSVSSPAHVDEVVTFQDGVGYTVGESLDAVIGSRLRISCKVSGVPTPRIQWIKNGKMLTSEENLGFSELVLQNIQTGDAGRYTCVAGNAAGGNKRGVRIEVLEPPKIFRSLFDNSNQTESVVNMEVISGQAFYMHCHPYGNPMPEVYWFKDEIPLRLFDDSMVTIDYGEVIETRSAAFEHSGNYTCVARNRVGNTSLSYLVDVLVPPPTPKESSKSVTVRVGRPLQLNCPVEGSPLPYAKWMKHPYTDIENSSRIQLLKDNYTLFINTTEVSDSGLYSCVLTNKVGTSEAGFAVVVEKPPRILTDGEERVVVGMGRSAILKCEVDGHPMPKITWLKDTQPISSSWSNIHLSLSNSLVAVWSAHTRDAGRYLCVAENTAGTAHARHYLAVRVPGKWSVWSKWDYCNVTCGLGYQHRSRVCQYIDDDNKAFDSTTSPDTIVVDESACRGLATDRRKCHMPSCEEDVTPRWSSWSKWSECSTSCGAGTRARTRKCRTSAVCYGDNVQIKKCTDLPKCGIDSQLENEVYNKDEKEDASNSPYIPEAIFEAQPEEVEASNYNDVEEFRGNTYTRDRQYGKPQPSYHEVNVTENLDRSERGPCDPGYTYNITTNSCEDIDECTIESNRCHLSQYCENTMGGYRCGCVAGYMAQGAGSRCLDINECILDISGCEYACVNVAGGYVCACPGTLRLHVDRRHCVQPSRYREPLTSSNLETDDDDQFLSTYVDAPVKYTRMPTG